MTESLSPTPWVPAKRAALWSLVLGLVSIPAIAAFGSGGLTGVCAARWMSLGFVARAGHGRGWMAVTGIVLGAIAVLVILDYLVALLTDDTPGISS